MSAAGEARRAWSTSSRPHPASPGQRGFTLFELLVTVAILGLITGLAFPVLQGVMAHRTIFAARSAVALSVARARSAAIAGDLAIRITLASDATGQAGQLALSGGLAPEPLPAGATIEWPRDGVVVFGDGSATGATGTIQAGTAVSRFTVDPGSAQTTFAP